MKIHRRALVVNALAAAAAVYSPGVWAQANRGARKLLIGQSVPLTGAADQIGLAYLNGAKLYFDAFNANTGVDGHRIEVKALDDGYHPEKAATNARQLIAEGVDALFGFVGTASCDAAFAVAKPTNTLFFAPFAASDKLRDTSQRNAFHIRPALADEAYKMVRHCATLNLTRMAVFAEDDAMGRAGLAAVNQALEDLKLGPLVASAFSPVNSDKVDAAVAALVKASPQAILQVSLFNTSAAFTRAIRKSGYSGQLLNFSVVGIDPLFTALGKDIGGVVISQVVPSPRNAGMPIIKEYLAALNQTDQNPSYESVEGFIAARTFAEGVRRSATAGRVDRSGLQRAFESMTDYDAGGFRVNLRAKKYESVRLVDLVSVTADGRIVR